MTKKQISKITPTELYKAECTNTPIEFIRLNDLFKMNEIVSKLEIKNTDSGLYAIIHFENSGLNTKVRIITD